MAKKRTKKRVPVDQAVQKSSKSRKASSTKNGGSSKPKKKASKSRKAFTSTMGNYKPRKSKHVHEALLKGEKTHGNYVKYDIKPSQVTDEEVKKMAKLANDRLYKLEKSGMSEYSREYKFVEHYATGDPNGKGKIYNVSEDFSRIRFTSSTRGMTQQERSYYINTLRNFIRAETSTVSGTKKAIKTAFETFKSKHGKNIPNLTQEEYANYWKTYREMVQQDKYDHKGYNAAYLELIESGNLYGISQDQLEEAIKYIEESKQTSVVGVIDEVVNQLPWLAEKYGIKTNES